ncbi:TetR/AcrR family transcriptional regulator [Rhodococcus sp. JVH1]|uniref:TetR/AcrR family transcriptional regulator n=1 Tax=Rhodococcus sp. JVH1 TaxID=745408 RepID=UPI0006873F9F
MPRSTGGASPEQRIAGAVVDLLRSRGPRAVTIEAVATRTGMARTTIYRRYRDRDEMLTAAMAPITQPTPPGPDVPPIQVLRWVVEQSRRAVEGGIGFGGMAALVMEDEPWFTELMRSLLVQHRSSLAQVLQQRIAAGQIREDLEVETFLDCIVGAYVAERARSGQVEPDWADRVTHSLFPAFAQPQTPSPRAPRGAGRGETSPRCVSAEE